MKRRTRHDVRDALWLAMVKRGESLNDLIVLTQAKPTRASARKIKSLASHVTALATASLLVGGGDE